MIRSKTLKKVSGPTFPTFIYKKNNFPKLFKHLDIRYRLNLKK